MLSQILELSSSLVVEKSQDIIKELSVLSYYSHGSTMHLTKYSSINTYAPYHPVFDSLWAQNGNDYYSYVDDLVNNKLALKLIQYNSVMKEVASQDHNQAMLDLQTLCERTLQNSSYLTSDKLKILNNLLFDRVLQALSVHDVVIKDMPSSSLEITQEVINVLGARVVDTSNETLGHIYENYFSTALYFIRGSSSDFNAMGRAWLLVSLGLMLLYVPSLPFDPAIRQHVEYDRARLLNKQYSDMRETWDYIKSIFIGCPNTELDKVWEKRLPKVQDIAVPSVYRPKVSHIGAIHDEWMTLIESSIGKTLITSFIEDKKLSKDSLAQIKLIQRNTAQFIGRSEANHEFYSDITSILHGLIYGLKMGLDLLTLPTLKEEVCPYFFANPVTLSQTEKLHKAFLAYRDTIKSMPARASEKMLLALLSAVDLIQKTENHTSPELEEITSFAFQNFYYKWSLNRIRAEQEAASKTTIFKDTTDEDADKDFMRMFPDFEDVVEIDESGKESDEDYSALMELYLQTFGESYTTSLTVLTSVGNESLQDWAKIDPELFITHDVSSILPALTISLSTTLTGQRLGSNEIFDFYHQPKPDETVKVSKLIVRLRVLIGKFLEVWPEHATLQSIDSVCEDLLSFPMSTPVAHYLQRIERLYSYLDEWERFSSRDYTVKTIFNEMTELIVSWRRLELSTWPKLFEVEEKNLNKELGKWWFYLFENLIENPSRVTETDETEDTTYPTLVQTLNIFMSQSSYGQFGTRLRLLGAFSKHTLSLASVNPTMFTVSECIANVIKYYSQYSVQILNQIATGKKALQKDINEVILLASWKDTNVNALRESAKRSHSKLYRVLRKYRTLITQSVEPVVNSGMETLPDGSVGFVSSIAPTASYKSVAQYVSVVQGTELWQQRPARLTNVEGTANLLHGHLISIQEETLPSIEKFAKSLVEEMDRLRKETPSVLTEENKSAVSSLKNEKSKLLTDTLKELKRGGLKTNVRADVKAHQLLVSGIMATVPSLTGKSIGQGDQYFYRILDLFPRLRIAVAESASDGPVADLVRGLAMSENLFASIISHRKHLDTLTAANADVSALLDTVNSFASLLTAGDRTQFLESRSDAVSQAQSTISWIPKLMKFAVESCYQSTSLGKFKYTKETIIFTETESRFKDLAIRFEKFKSLISNGIMTQSLNQLVVLVRKELNDLAFGLQKWKLEYPNLAFIGDMVIAWVSDRSSKSLDEPKHTQSEFSLMDLDKNLRNICDSVLVLVQKGREILTEDISQENDNWFLQSQSRLSSYCRILRQTQFAQKIKQALVIANSIAMQQDEALYQQALGYIGSAIPFIHEYFDLCRIVETRMIHNFASTTKGAYILMKSLQSLAQNGFCSPQEQSTEQDSGATKEGTGLGDGSGAQNNSNDVEDDEDLSEHAQKDNEDQDKEEKNEDEDDNAVDIEGDMGAGNLEDASDQDKSDDEDNDDEDENELDEEVGDLDDLDPNAVDEKMWDEKGEDNDKEKKSDQIPEGGNDDDLEAKDEEGEDGPEPKQSEEGNNENEEDENADEEEDVGEQEDNVHQQEKEDLESQVPETDTLELPEDMNLDAEDDDDEKADGKDEDDIDMPDVDDDQFDGGDDKDGKDDANKQDGMDADSDAEKEGDEEEEDQEIEADAMETDENPAEDGQEEEGEGENENPEEDLAQVKPEEGEEAENSNETENTMKFDTEGLHGPDQAEEDDNADADDNAVSQEQSTNQSEGSEQAAEKEQENLENSGGQSSTKPENDQEKAEEEESNQDQARKDVENSMKQLGDALKEFHKRKQEIQEASEKDDTADQGANERPDEFEHVDGANSSAQDTQALGAASQDQVQKIDDSKAIEDDEEMEDAREPETHEVDAADQMEIDENMPPSGQESSDLPQTAGSIVGERKKEEENFGASLAGEAMDIDEEDDESDEDAETAFEVAEAGYEPARSLDDSRDIWRTNETLTQESAMALCEQLRLILEPTQATKLRGDFKTGKRLNMKRIIPYIASQFKKDKIWMRRTKPSKRQYQVMIAVDDSKSMSESQSVKLAFQSIALISKALTQLEAGQLAIARFGGTTQLVHPFEKPFSSESGAHALQWFGFDQERTDVKALVQKSITMFEEAAVNNAVSQSAAELWRLEIIISDGVCEDHDSLQRLVRRAREERIMMVFVIVDGVNNQDSILDLNEVSYETDESGNMGLKINRYLDHFPFDFYVIVKDVRELPNVLSLVLRQFFAEVAESS